MNNFKMRPVAVSVLLALSLQGCASSGVKGENKSFGKTVKETFANDDPCANNKRNIGVAVGAIIGAIIGKKVSDKNKGLGTVIGAGIGGSIGGLIGAELDNRQCNLSKIQKKNALDMQMTPIKANVEQPNQKSSTTNPTQTANNNSSNQNASGSEPQTVGLSVSVIDQAGKPQFLSGSDELQPDAKEHFLEIAKEYSADHFSMQAGTNNPEQKAKINDEMRKKRILLIGHTDDTGNSKANADLSERRAKSVAKLFKAAGVYEDQLYYQGAGETMPIADDATEDGRAKNRRVEIVDLSNEDTFNAYLASRQPNTSYYRPSEANSSTKTSEPIINKQSQVKTTASSSKKTPPQKAATKAQAVKTVTATTSSSTTNTQKTKPTDKFVDFGGKPFSIAEASVKAGDIIPHKVGFSLINEAHASDIGRIATCNIDRPRNAGLVKLLKDDSTYRNTDYLPGLNGHTWYEIVAGNMVVLHNVAVLRDGASPANRPELKVYANYKESKTNKNPIPDIHLNPDVNTYLTTNGLLYRVFTRGNGGLQCMDILMPTQYNSVAKEGKLVYGNDSADYVSNFKPKIQK